MDDPILSLVERLRAAESGVPAPHPDLPREAADVLMALVPALEKIADAEPVAENWQPLRFYAFVDKVATEALEKARKIARGE